MSTRFLIVCTGHNCAPYVYGCVNSVLKQTNRNYDYVFIDDASTDSTYQELIALLPKEKIIRLENRVGTVKAHHIGILSATDYDVVVWLDMDDELLHCAVERISAEYKDPNVWLTYGNYVDRNGEVFFDKKNIDFPDLIHQENAYRIADWKFIHLRSFRRQLYNHLTDADLFLPESIKAYIDYNLWICMMEMAGKEHMRGIADVIYYYNNLNPSNLMRSYTLNQLDDEKDFCKKITPKQKLNKL